MVFSVEKVDMWSGPIKDRPGGLSNTLETLHAAGVNLEFFIARRAPDKPGTGVVFVAPVKGVGQTRAAKKVGMARTDSLHSLRLEAPDRPGLGAQITHALADAGINLRGLSAAVLKRRSIIYFAFDNRADAAKAARVLRKLLK